MSLRRYRDVSPVALAVVGGAESSLYCERAVGVAGQLEGGANLVESFLVEVYRCKVCQFTCGLKDAIAAHLRLRHRPPDLACLGGAEDEEGAGLRRGAEPYRLDLSAESKSDDDDDFLLYNMLGGMTPPTCDITEGGMQVAHTCEVSTLFEEESSIFPLKAGSVDLSCPIDPAATQEEMAQSAHLMTLGLCRISAARPPPPPAARSAQHRPPADDSSRPPPCGSTDGVLAPGTRRLPCLLCPLTLPSRRLLDVHVRSHRAAGGFGCVRCGVTADSWEQLEPHWRTHCRRRREPQKKKKTNAASRQQTHADRSEGQRSELIGRAGRKKAKRPDGNTTSAKTSSDGRKRTKNPKTTEEETPPPPSRFCCSLCDRKFSTKLTLRRHLGVHGGDKPFSCPHCCYSNRLKASLLQHLRTHTGEKPYRCSQCSYASIDRSSLLRHVRTHSQEKPYRCDRCDYSSIQKKSLDLHTRRHHTGEAFPCQQCEYSSPDRQLLLRHVRRHHAPPL